LAWPAAISRVAAAMAAAGREAAEVERFQAFQSFGPAGADGRAGTADDLKDPLAGVQHKMTDQAVVTTPADPIDQAIQSGVAMILAGEGERATEHFRKLVVSSRPATDRLFALVMDYLAVAQALQAGHGLACEGCAFELAVAKEPMAAVWRDQAYQFLHRHEALVRELIDQGHGELALGLCRSMANEDRLPERSRVAVDLAWQACQEIAPGGTAEAALPRFQQFGQTLSSKQARIHRVLLATETLKESGDDAALLAEMESVRDIWDQAVQNPMLGLLHASALVRLGKSAEVLGEVEELCRRSDPAPEWRYRAQLLLGVIHIQEGRPAAARAALQRLLDEDPPRDDRGRAIIILRKLQM
jgi:tetratricopeptide (TPR) repeat protein